MKFIDSRSMSDGGWEEEEGWKGRTVTGAIHFGGGFFLFIIFFLLFPFPLLFFFFFLSFSLF